MTWFPAFLRYKELSIRDTAEEWQLSLPFPISNGLSQTPTPPHVHKRGEGNGSPSYGNQNLSPFFIKGFCIVMTKPPPLLPLCDQEKTRFRDKR